MTTPATEAPGRTDAAFQSFLETLAGDAIGRYQQIERTIRAGDVAQRESAVLLAVGSVTTAAYLAAHAPPALGRLQAIETAAHALLSALTAYQDGLTSGTGDLEPLYVGWLRAVHNLEVALR